MSCNKDKMPWEPWEDEVIARLYPTGGTRAVGEVLSHRKAFAIQKRASLNDVSYGVRAAANEPAWAIPAHDYCEADLALRGWGATASDLGTPVGVLSPSLGLVLGVAA